MVSNKEIKKRYEDRKKTSEEFKKKCAEAEVKGFFRINSSGNSMVMVDEGIKTLDGQFIKYRDIQSIQDKTNVSRQAGLGLGLMGLASSAITQKTIEIQFIGGKVLIRDIKKDNAINFIHAVRKKIRISRENAEKLSKTTEKVDPMDRIRKAKELLDVGAISEEENQKIKNKYLEQV